MIHVKWRYLAPVVPCLLASGIAAAGGPLVIRTNGEPFVWNTADPIEYRTDNGPLSASVKEGSARSRVASMFQVWQAVDSATISYERTGFIDPVPGFADGDVSTLAEYDAVDGDCSAGNQSPIIDADGTIFRALGLDEESIIGFAGPCAIDPAQGLILSGSAVMNGLFQDGQETPVRDLLPAEFNATFIHEFGHFSGLDHSQINAGCGFVSCGADLLAGLPTMFPLLVSAEQATLSIDDVGWISMLYPASGPDGFSNTHGRIIGTVYFSDAESHAQLVNIIARRVDIPGGVDESRTTAASAVSGNKFRIFHGNPINQPDPTPFGPFRSQNPSHIGFYEIPLPPGDYRIELESIRPEFTGGSSVGGETVIPIRGGSVRTASPITVTAGVTRTFDSDLNSTPPRFDQFESP
jgi:hypothetical protein